VDLILFFVPDRPIFGAGADDAAGAVFRDTGNFVLEFQFHFAL